MVKVAHLTSAHAPLDVRIFEKECRSLYGAGYEVCIVAPHRADEQHGGIRIHAVPQVQGRLGRFTKTIWNVYRAALKEDAAIYHFHDPDLMPVAWMLKLHGKRIIYDVHENYRKLFLSKDWIPHPVRRLAGAGVAFAEFVSGAWCDGVVVAAPPMACPFPVEKTCTVANFPTEEFFDSTSNTGLTARKQGRVVYVGGISISRGVETMVDAIGAIREDLHPELAIAGVFPEALQRNLAGRMGWERTRLAGRLGRTEVLDLLHSSEVGLCVIHPTPNHVNTYAIKLFEYMACGLPVVASDFPLWREFVADTKCGFLVDPMDARAVAEAIGWLLEHPEEARNMGRNGQRAVREKYNWHSEERKLLHLYENVAAGNRGIT